MLTACLIALALWRGVSVLSLHLLGSLGGIPLIIFAVLSIGIIIWIVRLPTEKTPPKN